MRKYLKSIVASITLLSLLINSNSCFAKNNVWKLRPDGISDLKIGMNFDQINNLMGGSIKKTDPSLRGSPNCDHVPLPQHNGISLIFINDQLRRIDVISKNFSTEKGIIVGDPVKRVLKYYPNIVTTPQEYNETEKSLTDTKNLDGYGMRFETRKGKIFSIHAGFIKELMLSEGCL